MSKNLILFLLISFCSFSGGINGKSIEESLEEICDRISRCRSDEEEKKSSIRRILNNSLYEFDYKDKNGNYKFYIPEDTEIIKGKNKNIFLIIYKIHLAYSTENIIAAELTKGKTSKFTFNTEKFEDYVNYRLGNEVNSKDKILEFRKRLLDRNKNFIKTREDIEYNGIKSTNTLEYIEEQMCPFVPNDSRIEETLKYPLYEFVFSDEDKVYSFFIPIFTRITTDKNSKDIFLLISEDRCVDLFAEIAKLEKQPNSKFKLNTDELELLLKSRGVENYKNKVLKFRKQFLEKNKNLIK